jgi:hypothetical protein
MWHGTNQEKGKESELDGCEKEWKNIQKCNPRA